MSSPYPLLQFLDRMSCGAIVVDMKGEPIASNTMAIRILGREGAPTLGLSSLAESGRVLRNLLIQSGQDLQINSECWVTISRDCGAPLVLHTVPLGGPGTTAASTIVILIDLRYNPRPTVSVLQKLFDLTPAEARLAIEIASGQMLSEISSKMRLSSATLRTQLSAVFTKTKTRRQAELIAVLTRVAIFP
ncbi:helix-turn-helix transcriptional regulator [Methylobacterium sp. Leaf99]|uniref:helix-turn-helix transcriptional regulator n=1 Tax=Methylobacterium sp. Leaf99 TaxID=1736251 RepID=UPI0012EDCB64|nr:LuxR C-terminal-related transcriptional regulator [Methylobacterium sp. Leaf99]